MESKIIGADLHGRQIGEKNLRIAAISRR